MDSPNTQLMLALVTLRDALSEMALILSDYQFEADTARRRAAMEQTKDMLERAACQSPLPDCGRD